MPELPTCQCVQALPPLDRLTAIYCALLAIAENGGGGGITLSQITDLDPSWIAILQAPVSNFSITVSQISNLANGAVINFLTSFPNPIGSPFNLPSVDNMGVWTAQVGVPNGTVSPVTSLTTTGGAITAIS